MSSPDGQAQGQPAQGQPAQGQQGQQGQPQQPPAGAVPPWSGQVPSAHPGQQQQPTPWHDPNRYAQPGQRPQMQDPRSQHQPPQRPQQQPREDPAKRPPLSLRTRWARGLAIGGALCTLATLLNGYRNFPSWLIGAAVGLVMSLVALWFGAFAQRDAVRNSQRAPEAVAAVVWSGVTTLVAVAIVALSLVFYPQLRDYSNCMRSANTIAGQKTCQTQLNNALTFQP
ncbi:MAG: hypothetical protein ACRDVE_09835 [Actinocrinis sp.]